MTMSILPTLQKKIRSGFFRLVLLFGGLSLLLIVGIFLAVRTPALLVRLNYDSISYAQMMEEAFNSMLLEKLAAVNMSGSQTGGAVSVSSNIAQWQTHFESALTLAAGNITEPDEQAAVQAITLVWKEFLQHPSVGVAENLHTAIVNLVKVNERGMFRMLDDNLLFRDVVVLLTVGAFLVGTLWAFLLADGVVTQLAHPLRRAAEVFRDRPPFGQKLHLPDPQTLEVRILFDELSRLWRRLGELNAINVDTLLGEKGKLEVILESAEDAVLVLDGNGHVLHVSSRMVSLLGLSKAEILGQAWADLSTLAPNYLALRAVLQPEVHGVQDIVLHGQGEEQLYTARHRDLLGSTGQVTGQVFLLSNVTEKRRRDALRSEMMDWISHELKTPMQSLGLAADLLSRRDGLDDEMRMLVDTVSQDAARLRIVARQFMDMARMSPLALQLVLERVDMTASLDDWLTPFQLMAREGGIALHVETDPACPEVTLDTERFAWVVSNLLGNALRVCPRGSTVTVLLHAAHDNDEGEMAVLEVQDNGPGIPPELESRLFQPYSHGRTAGSHEGLVGLGLAIAHTIVEAHGGSIQYARSPEGNSIFTVSLPAASGIRLKNPKNNDLKDTFKEQTHDTTC